MAFHTTCIHAHISYMRIGEVDYARGVDRRQYHLICTENSFDSFDLCYPQGLHSTICQLYHLLCGHHHNPVKSRVKEGYIKLYMSKSVSNIAEGCRMSNRAPMFFLSHSGIMGYVTKICDVASSLPYLNPSLHSVECAEFHAHFFRFRPEENRFKPNKTSKVVPNGVQSAPRATGLKAIVSPWKNNSVGENILHVGAGALLGAVIGGGGSVGVIAATGTAITVELTAEIAGVGFVVGAIAIAIIKTCSGRCCS